VDEFHEAGEDIRRHDEHAAHYDGEALFEDDQLFPHITNFIEGLRPQTNDLVAYIGDVSLKSGNLLIDTKFESGKILSGRDALLKRLAKGARDSFSSAEKCAWSRKAVASFSVSNGTVVIHHP
jgi:hypothetical protein